MAKRSRKRKKTEDVRPADHKLPSELAGEVQWVMSGPVYAKFDAHIDSQLESLVSRWSHVAAPGSSSVRRFFRQAARHTSSGQV